MNEIADGVFIETEYHGVNVGAIVTAEGIICIDAPSYPREARDWVTRLERLHPRPIKFLILTDSNGDRLLNTRWINAPIVAHDNVAKKLNSFEKRYPQSMIDSLVERYAKYGKELSNGPVDRPAMSFENDLKIVHDHQEIVLSYMPGPTSGNIWVEIPAQEILFTGDSLVVGTQPYIAEMYWQNWIDSLEKLNDRLKTRPYSILPGRGEVLVSNGNAITSLMFYLKLLRSKVNKHVERGARREELAALAEDLANEYPLDHLPIDWVYCQIRQGLERLYDEINANNNVGRDKQTHHF